MLANTSLHSVSMRLLSSAFPLSTRDGYHEPSISQHDTANKISLISLPSVNISSLTSVSPLSIWDCYHQPSLCQHETVIMSLPSPNMKQLIKSVSSAFPPPPWNRHRHQHHPSLSQHEAAIISLPSVKMRPLTSAFPLSTWDNYHQTSLSTIDGYHQSSPCQNETAIISLPSINMTSLTKSEPSDDPCQHETPSDVSIRVQIQLSMYAQNLSAAFCLIFLNPFSSTADICNCQLRLSVPSDTQSITISPTIFGTTLIRPAGVCNTEINTLMLMKYAAPYILCHELPILQAVNYLW